MKTVISIPDEVLEAVQKLAQRTKRARGRIFSDALREYVARHALDEVTDAMDRVCAEPGATPDAFVASAARRVVTKSEW